MRIAIKSILADPAQRRRLLIGCLIALQAREGITTTPEQAEAAYAAVQRERSPVALCHNPMLQTPLPHG